MAWAYDRPGAREMLGKIWETSPDTKIVTFDVFKGHYLDWPDKKIFFEAFGLFLQQPMEENLRHAYDRSFIRLPSEDFPLIYPYLEKYVTIVAENFDLDHFLIRYLGDCVRQYPQHCITVLQVLFRKILTNKSYFFAKQALQVLLEAYNVLSDPDIDKSSRNDALDLFDFLLTRPDCRNNVDQILQDMQTVK